eukprot:TRINITY_DN21595_c0_g1_i1.p1 TRINITY_DN21595_c0_g1~~TRINITY_DN21595_c0_g1_i1.p1  ORF type:complete len:509 (-),score=33.57 TRINITY_DN21595_c0_g1_i1:375-1901(-)
MDSNAKEDEENYAPTICLPEVDIERPSWSAGSAGLEAEVATILENARKITTPSHRRKDQPPLLNRGELLQQEEDFREDLYQEYLMCVAGLECTLQGLARSFQLVRICCVVRYDPSVHGTDDPYRPKVEHYYIYQPPQKKPHLGSVYRTTVVPHGTDLNVILRIFNRKYKQKMVLAFENHAPLPAAKNLSLRYADIRVLRNNNLNDMMDMFWNGDGGKAIKGAPKLPPSKLRTKYIFTMVKELATPDGLGPLPPPKKVKERVPHSFSLPVMSPNNFKISQTVGKHSFSILSPTTPSKDTSPTFADVHSLNTTLSSLNLAKTWSRDQSPTETNIRNPNSPSSIASSPSPTKKKRTGSPKLLTTVRRNEHIAALAKQLQEDELSLKKKQKKNAADKRGDNKKITADQSKELLQWLAYGHENHKKVVMERTEKKHPLSYGNSHRQPWKTVHGTKEKKLVDYYTGKTTEAWQRRIAVMAELRGETTAEAATPPPKPEPAVTESKSLPAIASPG